MLTLNPLSDLFDNQPTNNMAQWTQFPNFPSTTSNQFISQTFHLSRQQLFTSALGQLGKEEEHLLPSTPWEPCGTVFPAYCVEGWPNPATFDNFKIKQTFKEICQMETWRRNNDCIKIMRGLVPSVMKRDIFTTLVSQSFRVRALTK